VVGSIVNRVGDRGSTQVDRETAIKGTQVGSTRENKTLVIKWGKIRATKRDTVRRVDNIRGAEQVSGKETRDGPTKENRIRVYLKDKSTKTDTESLEDLVGVKEEKSVEFQWLQVVHTPGLPQIATL